MTPISNNLATLRLFFLQTLPDDGFGDLEADFGDEGIVAISGLLLPEGVLFAAYTTDFLLDEPGLTVVAELGGEGGEGGVALVGLEFAFPDGDDVPAHCLEKFGGGGVTLGVAADLGGPEVGVGLGDDEVLAPLVAVPEAAVDEDDGVPFPQDYVGGAGELADVQAVAESFVVEVVAHNLLGARILRADAGHVVGALCGRGRHSIKMNLFARSQAASLSGSAEPSSSLWMRDVMATDSQHEGTSSFDMTSRSRVSGSIARTGASV